MRFTRLFVLACFVVSLVFASVALAQEAQPVPFDVKGTVASIDTKANTFVVKVESSSDSLKSYITIKKDEKGNEVKEVTIQVNENTKFFMAKEEKKNNQTIIVHEKEVKFADLKVGAKVVVKGNIVKKDGVTSIIATEVNILG